MTITLSGRTSCALVCSGGNDATVRGYANKNGYDDDYEDNNDVDENDFPNCNASSESSLSKLLAKLHANCSFFHIINLSLDSDSTSWQYDNFSSESYLFEWSIQQEAIAFIQIEKKKCNRIPIKRYSQDDEALNVVKLRAYDNPSQASPCFSHVT